MVARVLSADQGGSLSLSLFPVAGDASVSSVEIKGSTEVGTAKTCFSLKQGIGKAKWVFLDSVRSLGVKSYGFEAALKVVPFLSTDNLSRTGTLCVVLSKNEMRQCDLT